MLQNLVTGNYVRFLGHPLSNLFIILNVLSRLTQNLTENIKTMDL